MLERGELMLGSWCSGYLPASWTHAMLRCARLKKKAKSEHGSTEFEKDMTEAYSSTATPKFHPFALRNYGSKLAFDTRDQSEAPNILRQTVDGREEHARSWGQLTLIATDSFARVQPMNSAICCF